MASVDSRIRDGSPAEHTDLADSHRMIDPALGGGSLLDMYVTSTPL
jgi:hypothetical protein